MVEQMTRESAHLDVDKVIGFLMDAKLADARPLINVCDRFDRVTDLTKFLYENNLLRYIEGYVQKVNPAKTPQVVGGLLDCQADEEFISNLIMSVRPPPPLSLSFPLSLSLSLSLALSLSLSSVLPSLFLQPLSTATVRSLPTVIVRLMKANCALSCQRIRAMRARLSGCERCVLSCQRMRAVHTVVSTDANSARSRVHGYKRCSLSCQRMRAVHARVCLGTRWTQATDSRPV